MIVPRRAPVRPRVLSPATGAALLLEEVVRDLIAQRNHGSIEIVGPIGCGKTTALEHLAAVFAKTDDICFLDRPTWEERKALDGWPGWVVSANAFLDADLRPTAVLRLVPWAKDDCIEYLLSVHKDQCASVMARLQASQEGGIRLAGNAELCRIVLDVMARDKSIRSAQQALEQFLATLLGNPKMKKAAATHSLVVLINGSAPELDSKFWGEESGQAVVRALCHRPLQILVATEQILRDLQAKSGSESLRYRLPRDLVEQIGKTAAEQGKILAKLTKWYTKPELQAMTASILHAAGAGGTLLPLGASRLAGAYLSGIKWPGIALPGADLSEADLSDADLREANLNGARAWKANLSNANLRGARLEGLTAAEADLSKAELSAAHACEAVFDGANLEHATLENAELRKASFTGTILSGARFFEADLQKAKFADVKLTDADFTAANLEGAYLTGVKLREACFSGARFAGAQLAGCDLEGMELPAANFTKANLEGALLTGSSMPDARFDDACLKNAGLAVVEWERVSLRGADLRGASFHLGSSRSGLVGSPIASEGSRTGFYTDDYNEQEFKSPEEIRKANLCHADLRGARIDDVDFYLVDLRHALFDAGQEPHLRRCGAILESRC